MGRPPLALFPLFVAVAFVLNCGGGDEPLVACVPYAGAPAAQADTPVLTAAPPVALVPAFPGLPALEQPIALVEAPGRDLFLIALRDGRVLAIPEDGPWERPCTVHDQRPVTACCEAEQGLLSLALDPGFSRNGYLYVYYSVRGSGPETWLARIDRFQAGGEGDSFAFDPSSKLTIIEIELQGAYHNGGTLAFGPDGMLYLGVGDGYPGNRRDGQDAGTLPGTVIRIDVRGATEDVPYRIPPDNPHTGRDDARPEVWAHGLRNPWRMSFDRETGLLWAGDVGGSRREEVNVIRVGGNYGWSILEGTWCKSGDEACARPDLIPPVWEYSTEGCAAIIGGYVYRGDAIPELRGWYLFGDFCSGLGWMLPAGRAAAGTLVEAARLWNLSLAGEPLRITSLAEDAGGELYILGLHGLIYRAVSAGTASPARR